MTSEQDRRRAREVVDAAQMDAAAKNFVLVFSGKAGDVLDEHIAAEFASVRQEALESAWQPIETAPKDGTQILICTKERTLQIAWWSPTSEQWSYGAGSWGDNARYWMPLPPPPAIRSLGEER